MEVPPHMYMHFSVGLHSNNLCMWFIANVIGCIIYNFCGPQTCTHTYFLEFRTSMVVDTKSFMCGSGISVGSANYCNWCSNDHHTLGNVWHQKHLLVLITYQHVLNLSVQLAMFVILFTTSSLMPEEPIVFHIVLWKGQV